jgi:hypothetical protein
MLARAPAFGSVLPASLFHRCEYYWKELFDEGL